MAQCLHSRPKYQSTHALIIETLMLEFQCFFCCGNSTVDVKPYINPQCVTKREVLAHVIIVLEI